MHIASLAGAYVALVSGFGGLRHQDSQVSFMPRLPEGIARLKFHVLIRGRRLHVEVTHPQVRYELDDGEPLTIIHYGRELNLLPDKPQTHSIPALPARPLPSQPPGREPAHRLGGEQPK